MKIAICDDNEQDANIILSLCHKCDLPYEIAVFSTASELLCAFSSDFFDLVFLDIQMAHPNGYEVGVELSTMNPKPLIIFTTNSQQYAIQGYGIAFRYLCKPITLPLFRQAIMDAIPYILPQKITLSYGGTQKMVFVNDILYFESLAHLIIFHLTGSKTFKVKDSMEHIIKTLQHPNFVHVHRSFCVNLDYIDSIKLPRITLTDGTEIPVSRNKRDELLSRFTSRIGGNNYERLD